MVQEILSGDEAQDEVEGLLEKLQDVTITTSPFRPTMARGSRTLRKSQRSKADAIGAALLEDSRGRNQAELMSIKMPSDAQGEKAVQRLAKCLGDGLEGGVGQSKVAQEVTRTRSFSGQTRRRKTSKRRPRVS